MKRDGRAFDHQTLEKLRLIAVAWFEKARRLRKGSGLLGAKVFLGRVWLSR